MNGAICKTNRIRSSRVSILLLSYFWLIGLFFGTAISFVGREYLIRLMPVLQPVLRSGHLRIALVLVPFLLSAFAVCFSRPVWLLWICGLKAFSFIICCLILCLRYGQATWLARWLYMFSDVCSLPLLLFFGQYSFNAKRERLPYACIVLFLALVLLIIVDYRIVTPFSSRFGII